MDVGAFFDAVIKTMAMVGSSSTAALLSIVGLVLLLLTGVFAYIAMKSKPDELPTWMKAGLFISLIGGLVFSAAGPGVALSGFAEKSITKMSTEQALKNLEDNTQVNYLIRLIAYNPDEEPGLKIDRLTNLGPPDQLYSFVSSYDELVGYRVKDALEKVGQNYRSDKKVSAIIFPLRTALYPANARGLLQVIREVENRRDIQTHLTKKLLDSSGSLNQMELQDLTSTNIPSYRLANFKDKYQHYCALAREFYCSTSYSARPFLGTLSRDWHPLGFSQKDIAGDRCSLAPEKYCEFVDWKKTKDQHTDDFGTRVFLIRNLEIQNIPGRIMIDFDRPADQVIPDIGSR